MDLISELQQWGFLGELPNEFAGFQLCKELCWEESRFHIFSYRNEGRKRALSALYDKTTKDFMVYTIIGLFEFYDINFIAGDLSVFEKLLHERLRLSLQQMACFEQQVLGSVFNAKGIVEWDYGKSLPENVAGFQLFIKPAEPVKIINGSYVIIDYCDFNAESNLTVYYNIYRDEFFGEKRIKRLPQMVTLFDSKGLDELAEKLQCNLQPALEQMRQELAKT